MTINTFATVSHTGTDSVQSLTLSGGTLANSGDLTTQGLTLSSSFATLNDTGNLTVNGPFTWTSGNLTGAGHTVLNGASSLRGGFFSMLQYGVFFPLGGLDYLPGLSGSSTGFDASTSAAQIVRLFLGVAY